MKERYVFIEVHGSRVVCNCEYSNFDVVKATLDKSFSDVMWDNKLEYGKNCWKSDDGMTAWAFLDGKDKVWFVIKIPSPVC